MTCDCVSLLRLFGPTLCYDVHVATDNHDKDASLMT